MSEHEIYMTMPTKIVLNKDTDFDVYSDGTILGTLKISRGTIEWRPKGRIVGIHLEWEKFDQLMRKQTE